MLAPGLLPHALDGSRLRVSTLWSGQNTCRSSAQKWREPRCLMSAESGVTRDGNARPTRRDRCLPCPNPWKDYVRIDGARGRETFVPLSHRWRLAEVRRGKVSAYVAMVANLLGIPRFGPPKMFVSIPVV